MLIYFMRSYKNVFTRVESHLTVSRGSVKCIITGATHRLAMAIEGMSIGEV